MARMRRRGFQRVRIGFANGWLIRSRVGAVLVDAGFARRGSRVGYALARWGLRPRDLGLVIVTHVHFDHVGGLAEIVRATGAYVAVGAPEAGALRSGRAILPPAFTVRGRLAVALGRALPGSMDFRGVQPDVEIGDELDLAPWGLDGRVVATPGHSRGSVSVLLDNGAAFVGDLAASSFRRFLGVRPSVFGDDQGQILAGWRRVLDAGARVICPGHGEEFTADVLRRVLAQLSS